MDQPTLKPRGALASYSRSLHLLLIATIAFAQYLRKPVLFGASQLFKEDAGVLFAHYYHSAEHFFIYYMGYVSVGTNLLGWLATRAPTPLIGQAFVLVALLSAAGALSVLYLPRFRTLIASDRARLLCCLWLSILPIGNGPIVRAITWSFWPMLLAAGLLLAQPTPKPSRGRWFELGYLAIAICSSPVSLTLAPVCAYNAWRARDAFQRISSLGLALLIVTYVVVTRYELGTAYWDESALQWSTRQLDPLYAATHLLPAIGDRIVFEALATNFVRMRFIWRGLLACTAVGGLVGLAALVWAVRRVPVLAECAKRNASLLAVLSYLSIAITAVSIGARFGPGALDYTDYFHHRYFWVQQYYLWVVLAAFALALMPRLPQRAKQLVAACAVLYPLVGGYLDRIELSPGLKDREATEEFLQELHECEQQDCANPVVFHGHDERFDITIRDFR